MPNTYTEHEATTSVVLIKTELLKYNTCNYFIWENLKYIFGGMCFKVKTFQKAS